MKNHVCSSKHWWISGRGGIAGGKLYVRLCKTKL